MQVMKKTKEMRAIVKEAIGKSLMTDVTGEAVLVLSSRILAIFDWRKETLTFPRTWSNTTFEQTSPPLSFLRQRDEFCNISQELSKSNQ